MSTIRALKAEKILEMEFDHHQDTHSACWFVFLTSNAAFGFTLDMICSTFIACIISYFHFIDQNVPGEKVGLAITQGISLLGILQLEIKQSAEVRNQLMSVERILEFCGLESEKQPQCPNEVSVDWPTTGKIQFRNLIYRYYAEGAGKNSLAGAIFRMACIKGEILIDDIDTATVDLCNLRKRIAIIPQDPVLFSGTLRRYSQYGMILYLNSPNCRSRILYEFGSI